jgi:hypothetical protein
MTLIAFSDGKAVLRSGQIGTETACCCTGGEPPCGPDNPSTPFLLVRTFCANPETWYQEFPPNPRPEPDWVTFLQENWHYYNISVVEEIAGAQYAWYVSCCELDTTYGWIYLCGQPFYLPVCKEPIFP